MLAIVDLETTGLDPEKDEILEIAMMVVDDELERIIKVMRGIIIQPSIAGDLRMDDFVLTMHRESGVLDAIRTEGTSLALAYESTLAWVRDNVPENTPMCGNSVGFDRNFLRHYMPDVESHFHYRNVDVSSIRECAWRWVPRLNEKELMPMASHRSLNDCYDSLQLLRFYKKNIFDLAAFRST